jgi:superfamily II DNA or RNA helicase
MSNELTEDERERFWKYVPLGSGQTYTGPELRRWQLEALLAWEESGYSGVVEAITGTGKTQVGIAAIHEVLAQGGNAVVIVPTQVLLHQWAEKIKNDLPRAKVGTHFGERHDTFETCNVIVSVVNTLRERPLNPGGLGLLIADEAHRYGSVSNALVLSPDYQRRLALSGSFERQDDGIEDVLVPYFGRTIKDYSYEEALADRVVSPFHLGLVGVEFSTDERTAYQEASSRLGEAMRDLIEFYDYSERWQEFFGAVNQTLKAARKNDTWGDEAQLCSKYMQAFSERRGILAEAREKYKFVSQLGRAFDQLNGTLVFGETKDSAEYLAKLISADTVARALSSNNSTRERQQVLRDFGNGNIKVICTPRILDEGVDVPEAELAVVIATSQTKRQLIQRLGRVIRLKADGRHARLLLMYVVETPEDPASGGHEAFLEEILKVSKPKKDFRLGDEQIVARWLTTAQ